MRLNESKLILLQVLVLVAVCAAASGGYIGHGYGGYSGYAGDGSYGGYGGYSEHGGGIGQGDYYVSIPLDLHSNEVMAVCPLLQCQIRKKYSGCKRIGGPLLSLQGLTGLH